MSKGFNTSSSAVWFFIGALVIAVSGLGYYIATDGGAPDGPSITISSDGISANLPEGSDS